MAEKKEPLVVDNWKKAFLIAGIGEKTAVAYVELFVKHEVALDMLADLTHEVLVSIGIWKAGDRIRILRLKQLLDDPTDPKVDITQFILGKHTYVRSTRPATAPVANSGSGIVSVLPPSSPAIQRTPQKKPSVESMKLEPKNSAPSSVEKHKPAPIPDPLESATTPILTYDSDSSSDVEGDDSIESPMPVLRSHGKTRPIVVTSAPLSDAVNSVPDASLSSSTPPGGSFMQMAANLRSSSDDDKTKTGSLNLGRLMGEQEVKYFINDDIVKHKVKMGPDTTVQKFSQMVRDANKLASAVSFAIFTFDPVDNKLRILKEPTVSSGVYYVIENSKLDSVYKKLERKVKKDQSVATSGNSGRPVWTSDNNPMKVDFIPDEAILMNQLGRIGLCMAPGRKKKKAHHDWDRDLEKDLDRIRNVYGCDVFVSLIRRSELQALKITNLFEEVEKRGMESIHYPIKDKWIPNSMEGLIAVVEVLIQRLQAGKSVVIHCNGGKGRSATVAVACLVGLGKKVKDSIDVLRKARPGTIRNPLQILYVKRFKTAWQAYIKRKTKSATMGKIDFGMEDDGEEDGEDEEGLVQKLYKEHQKENLQSDEDSSEDKKRAKVAASKPGTLTKAASVLDEKDLLKKKEEIKKREDEMKKMEEQIKKDKEDLKKKEKEEDKAKKEEEKRRKEEEKLKKKEGKHDEHPSSSPVGTPPSLNLVSNPTTPVKDGKGSDKDSGKESPRDKPIASPKAEKKVPKHKTDESEDQPEKAADKPEKKPAPKQPKQRNTESGDGTPSSTRRAKPKKDEVKKDDKNHDDKKDDKNHDDKKDDIAGSEASAAAEADGVDKPSKKEVKKRRSSSGIAVEPASQAGPATPAN